MPTYKNLSHSVKTFYGVTFLPGDVKSVSGYINDPKFARLNDVTKPVSQPKTPVMKPIAESTKVPVTKPVVQVEEPKKIEAVTEPKVEHTVTEEPKIETVETSPASTGVQVKKRTTRPYKKRTTSSQTTKNKEE